MKSVSVSLEFLCNDARFESLIKETLDDRLIYNEGLEFLKHSQLFALYKGDVLLGFYSIDDFQDYVEAHAYIFKSCRNHSLSALRYIKDSQSKNIKTSVYGTHLHVLRFLCRLGFEVTNTLNEALVKNGQTYDVIELLLNKEKSNG